VWPKAAVLGWPAFLAASIVAQRGHSVPIKPALAKITKLLRGVRLSNQRDW
jgi:hypothetical protein